MFNTDDPPGGVFLHGKFSRLERARFTVKQVLAPLAKKTRHEALDTLAGRCLVVFGYGGQDDFDVMPVVFEKENKRGPSEILWLVHDRPLPAFNVGEYLDDARSTCLRERH